MHSNFQKHLIDYKIRNRQHRFGANFSSEMSENEFLDGLAKALADGADLVIFKSSATSRATLAAARKAKLLANEFDATFLVYDRADIAFLTEPDGIILDNNSISIADAEKLLGHETLIITES